MIEDSNIHVVIDASFDVICEKYNAIVESMAYEMGLEIMNASYIEDTPSAKTALNSVYPSLRLVEDWSTIPLNKLIIVVCIVDKVGWDRDVFYDGWRSDNEFYVGLLPHVLNPEEFRIFMPTMDNPSLVEVFTDEEATFGVFLVQKDYGVALYTRGEREALFTPTNDGFSVLFEYLTRNNGRIFKIAPPGNVSKLAKEDWT